MGWLEGRSPYSHDTLGTDDKANIDKKSKLSIRSTQRG